ncbi:hypothetical protein AVEN_227336-1 [Araneus ventricosus]|uniref:Uncharacterized protein n=1 Tax=Araneus ventricosus TaxID=182803 RepID=A0A4Y2GVS1_ARAVE|nr:hypothetical protein AVEN_227336-1 [Araneus ventricosus]
MGPLNLFLHSLFSYVDVSLNDRLVSSPNNTYPYRAYIETLLNHGYDSKTSQLITEMFYKDNEVSGDGLEKRSEFFKLNSVVDMIGGLHFDLFNQEKLLFNMVDIKINLVRSKPEFCFIGEAGCKVVLDHVSLFIRKVRVSPGITLGHAKALGKTTAEYPITRVSYKAYSIPQGSMSVVQDNVYVGQLPKRLVIGCVDNDAFHGYISKNPFNFKPSIQSISYNTLEAKFDQDNYIRAYQSLFLGTEKSGQDRGIFISRKEFRKATLYMHSIYHLTYAMQRI